MVTEEETEGVEIIADTAHYLNLDEIPPWVYDLCNECTGDITVENLLGFLNEE
jgi:hypothetical protein